MDEATIVDRLHGDFLALEQSLDPAEVSLRNTAGDVFRKALLLAAASYFENRMTATILEFVAYRSRGDELVTEFVKNKALTRQFHTLFDWKSGNANQFYGFFGDSFQDYAKKRARDDEEFAAGARAFMEIGRDRNRLVHEDFGNFSLEKTAEEIYLLYRDAVSFVSMVRDALNTWSSIQSPATEFLQPAFANRSERLRWR